MSRIAAQNIAVIGMGSNVNPKSNVPKAKRFLKKQCRLLGESKFIKTKPVGYKQQDDFLNGAVVVATAQTRSKFKSTLKRIETQLGRKRQANPYGPRTIDLDILVWNGKIVDRDFYTRKFIRQSVLELMPGLVKSK